MDLSVIIPARNEEFLNETINEVLTKSEADTEVIAILDGEWPIKPVQNHPRVTLIYHPESIGQRASVNEGVSLSSATFVMKLDAHCVLDQGFDKKLMADIEPTWTVIPRMYNLHAFDWVCPNNHKRYQGPSGPCLECGEPTEKNMVWKPRFSRQSDYMRFDRDLRFAYWGAYKYRPEAEGDIVPIMSFLGACFFMYRDRYWELDGLDEKHGSWGQMGTELACKSWLSGGKLMVNKKTWFAHMFRTQGGDFSFPYQLSNRQVEKARRHSRDLWRKGSWPKAKHDLMWLVNKFAPVPGWEEKEAKTRKAVVYYTDNRLGILMDTAQKQLMRGIKEKHIVSVSLKPLKFGRNYVVNDDPGTLTMFKQILTGLRALGEDEQIVYFCEHDVLYHPSHFALIPSDKDTFYYNTNVWKVDQESGRAVRVSDCRQLSGLIAWKRLLIQHFEKRIIYVEKHGYSNTIGYEPGTHGRIPELAGKSAVLQSDFPNLDIRHSNTLTRTKWSPDEFRNKKYTEGWTESHITHIPGWEGFTIPQQ